MADVTTLRGQLALDAGFLQGAACYLPDADRQAMQRRISERVIERGEAMFDLLAHVQAQHEAIDVLMATVIALDKSFMPTRWKHWPTVAATKDLVARVIEGKTE